MEKTNFFPANGGPCGRLRRTISVKFQIYCKTDMMTLTLITFKTRFRNVPICQGYNHLGFNIFAPKYYLVRVCLHDSEAVESDGLSCKVRKVNISILKREEERASRVCFVFSL